MGATTVGTIQVDLVAMTARFNKDLEKATKTLAERSEQMSRQIMKFGRELSLRVTAPLVALSAAALRASEGTAKLSLRAQDLDRRLSRALRPFGEVLGKVLDSLMPALDRVFNQIYRVGTAFQKMNPEVQTTIIKIGLIVAAVGPALLALGALSTVFTVMAKGLALVTPVIALANTALIGLATTVVAPIAAITVLSELLYTLFERFRSVQEGAAGFIRFMMKLGAWAAPNSFFRDAGLRQAEDIYQTTMASIDDDFAKFAERDYWSLLEDNVSGLAKFFEDSMKRIGRAFAGVGGRAEHGGSGPMQDFFDGARTGFQKLVAQGQDFAKLGETLTTDVIGGLSEGLAGALTDAAFNVESFGKSAGKVLENLGKQILKTALNFAFLKSITGIMEGLTTSTPQPGDSTFVGPVERHADGAVIRGPIPFYADGRRHVMGESGTELLMPLSSLRGGLGGGTVVQVFNQPGQTAKTERGRMPDGRELVKVLIQKEVSRGLAGGQYDQVLGSAFGLGRRGAAR